MLWLENSDLRRGEGPAVDFALVTPQPNIDRAHVLYVHPQTYAARAGPLAADASSKRDKAGKQLTTSPVLSLRRDCPSKFVRRKTSSACRTLVPRMRTLVSHSRLLETRKEKNLLLRPVRHVQRRLDMHPAFLHG
jgi:hypothetical protein